MRHGGRGFPVFAARVALIINVGIAGALGLTIPPSVLLRVDEVIQ